MDGITVTSHPCVVHCNSKTDALAGYYVAGGGGWYGPYDTLDQAIATLNHSIDEDLIDSVPLNSGANS